jgi:hypothetical protein
LLTESPRAVAPPERGDAQPGLPNGGAAQAGPALAPAAGATRADVNPWIINAPFDFVFVTGGAVLVFVAFNVFWFNWQVPARITDTASFVVLASMYLGQHLFADAHNTATYLRLWGSGADRERFKFHRTWLVWFCVGVFAFGLAVPKFVGFLVFAYLLTVFWHYAAQAFGMSLIYCYKRGYRLRPGEKLIFKSFVLSMAAFVVVRILTIDLYRPVTFFGVDLPKFKSLPYLLFEIATAAVIVLGGAFAVVLARAWLQGRGFMPWPALMVVATVGVLGLSSGQTNHLLWLYVQAFFHGSQYIAVTLSYRLKEDGLGEGVTTRQIARIAFGTRGRYLMAWAVVTGGFFYIVVPFFFGIQLGFDWALVAGLVLGCVNLHHFITDAAIWRLRDSRCREILMA